MAIPWGDENVLDKGVAPLTEPAVHAAVPEHVPAKVVTANVVKSIFLIALLSLSAISA
jgi:hypothetical protein